MALVVYDRVQEITTTSGTGSVTLLGAVSGFQSFAVVGNGNTTYYTITDGADWEVGIGTYSTSGPTLARTTVLSNSLGTTSPITLSGGTCQVFVTYPAEKSVNLDASSNVTPLGTIASGTWQGTTVGVSYGGTGVTASSGSNSVVLRDANQNTTLNNIFRNITSTVSAAGTTTLTAASSFTQVLTGSTTQTFKLPDATTLTNGASFQFNNNSTGNLYIVDYGSNAIDTVAAGGAAQIFLTSTSTANGVWDVHGFIPENVEWGTNSLYLNSTVITGGTWNGGTIGTSYGGTGLTSFTSGGALYATSTSSLTSGTLPVASGGSGATTLTGYVKGNGTSAFTASSTIPSGDISGLGTMATQNANSVAITGGTIDGTSIGATTASTGKFTSVTTPSVTATTTDLTLSAISTGAINFATAGGTQFKAVDATSSVNTWTVKGGDGSTTSPQFLTAGTGTNIAGQFNTKGTGALQFYSGNTEQMRVTNTASAVNYVQVTGSATTKSPIVSVAGTDTNISMAFQPKGTGAIDLAAGSSGVNISNGGTVTAVTRTAGGSGYTTAITGTVSAPTTAGGVQATVNVGTGAITVAIAGGGTGYTVGDTLTVVGGTFFTNAQTLTVSTVSAGVITAVSIASYGNYSVLPTNPVSVTGGTGSGATFNLSNWSMTTVSVNNAGSGYIEQPTVSFSGGGGSGAAAYATVGSGTVVKSVGSTMSFYVPSGEGFRVVDSASNAVNYVQTAGSATNAGVQLRAGGSDTNIAFLQSSKGTSQISYYTNTFGSEQFRVSHTASAVNYVQVTGNVTTSPPIISAQGSDSTVAMLYRTKGNGVNHSFQNGSGNNGFVVTPVNSTANYLQASSSIAGAAPVLSSLGTDTNIDLALTPKGTGIVKANGAGLSAENGLVINKQTVATNATIATGYSAMSAGPVTVASGISVTIASGSRWVVL